MKSKIFFCIVLTFITLSGFAQKQEGQYSLEATYGGSFASKPSISGFGHYDFGVRYMFEPNWGIKFDFGHDTFRNDETPEQGVDYTRLSLQAVHNLGRTLNIPKVTGGAVNALAHAGLGISVSKSTQQKTKDNMGNLIVGVTPQIYIFQDMSLQLDFSYVVNLLQHFDYDGTYRFEGAPKSFTGGHATASIGIIYYLGKRHSDYDWR